MTKVLIEKDETVLFYIHLKENSYRFPKTLDFIIDEVNTIKT